MEVDSSNYAIPHIENVIKWTRATPKDFTFHFKAFGPLCRNIAQTNMLPNQIRCKLSQAQRSKDRFIITELEENIQDEIWQLYNQALRPVHDAGKLGGRNLCDMTLPHDTTFPFSSTFIFLSFLIVLSYHTFHIICYSRPLSVPSWLHSKQKLLRIPTPHCPKAGQ